MERPSSFPGRNGYKSAEKAIKYSQRSIARNAAEEELLTRLLKTTHGASDMNGKIALDTPAGVGRMARHLRSTGFVAYESDISFQMLDLSRGQGSPEGFAVAGDLEGMLPFKDNSFDLVLCWRLIQHLPNRSALSRVFGELARVSRKWIIVSFFHPVSVHNLKRRLVSLFTQRPVCRFSYSKDEIQNAGRVNRLRLIEFKAQSAYRKDLWAAAFEKKAL